MPTGTGKPALFESIMWMARAGSQWRRLPDEYRKWNRVFRRYRRRVVTGVFDSTRNAVRWSRELCSRHKKGVTNRGAWPIASRLPY